MKTLRIGIASIPLVLLALTSVGCSAQRPVLYPNEAYGRTGEQATQQAIDECMRRAEAYLSSDEGRRAREVARGTAVGAGTGAAVGAVGGAVRGDPGEGAAVGAATGATAGFLHSVFGVFRGGGPDPTYKRFVERCLRERGYEPIGWD